MGCCATSAKLPRFPARRPPQIPDRQDPGRVAALKEATVISADTYALRHAAIRRELAARLRAQGVRPWFVTPEP